MPPHKLICGAADNLIKCELLGMFLQCTIVCSQFLYRTISQICLFPTITFIKKFLALIVYCYYNSTLIGHKTAWYGELDMLACPYSDGLALTGTGFMCVFVSFLVCGKRKSFYTVHTQTKVMGVCKTWTGYLWMADGKMQIGKCGQKNADRKKIKKNKRRKCRWQK